MSFIETERLRQATCAPFALRTSRDRLFDRLALAILVAVVCVIAFTFRDYSISTDEQVQNTYGRLLLDFYLSGLTNTRAFGYGNLYLYGGLFDLIAAVIASPRRRSLLLRHRPLSISTPAAPRPLRAE